MLRGRDIFGMHETAGTGSVISRATRFCSACGLVARSSRRATVGRRMVRRSGLPGLHHSVVAKCTRPWRSRDWRPALVHRSPQFPIGPGSLHMLSLSAHRRQMPSAPCLFLSRRRARIDPTVATVEAHAIFDPVIDDRRVVHVVDIGHVHIGHGAVVEEVSIVPTSAFETLAEVTKSVIDPAIESNFRAPEPFMENKRLTAPTPPARSPEKTDFRSEHPCARHPVVIFIVVIPIPVSRRPNIALAGADRLLIYGQRRRSECNRYSELGHGRRRQSQHYERQRKRTKR